MNPASHEDYLAGCSDKVRGELIRIQAIVEGLVPKAERCISYKMPAYKASKVIFYFAGFKKHIGIYPPVKNDADLIAELKQFRGPKGNLSFPLDHPLPVDLIKRVALALYKESR